MFLIKTRGACPCRAEHPNNGRNRGHEYEQQSIARRRSSFPFLPGHLQLVVVAHLTTSKA
ncbi:hypothetical protein M3J09_013798 [Ascochyta lentis]